MKRILISLPSLFIKINTALLLILIISSNSAHAQITLPSPTVDEFKNEFHKIHLYGNAALTSEKFNGTEIAQSFNSPNFGLIFNIRPGSTHLNFILSFNKGGNQIIKADSLRYTQSIVFTETGTSAFLGNISYIFEVNPNIPTLELTEIIPFYELATISRKIIIDTLDLPFDALSHSFGVTGTYSYFGNPLVRASIAVSYNILSIVTKEDNFRRAYDLSKDASTTLRGIGIKVVGQLNDFSIYFQMKNLQASSDYEVDKLTGWQFTLGISALATLF